MSTIRCFPRARSRALAAFSTGALATGLALAPPALATVTITEFPAGGQVAELVTGPDGNVWFTTELSNEIGRITPSGATVFHAVPSGSLPEGIAAGPDGNLWFTEQTADQIGEITTAGAITEYLIPTAGSWPTAITTGADGNLWFTEHNATRSGGSQPTV
jgi:streptogramin lyase